MIIREACVDDASAIARVHVDSWRTTYRGIVPDDYLASLSFERRERNWQQLLSQPTERREFIYVAELEPGQVIGFATGGKERSNHPIYKGELYTIYLLQNYQRLRIGHQLTLAIKNQFAEANIYSMLVWVLADNSACHFYEALGGQKIGEQPITIGGATLKEIAYGWMDTRVIPKMPE
ncbi:MAG: GNAT family N-acetyltransferase [Cyanobacteria bacterium CRU_2_1]|nr:GNAT family N-acetyltransferase [Cyanobacteria bacterium RU_5_0]NJR59304.1 GNAT family N-acetyltransferase [Cyanobacteria bacterium CRU_2_1]